MEFVLNCIILYISLELLSACLPYFFFKLFDGKEIAGI